MSDRALAVGGVIGPAAFVAGWWTLGARATNYHPFDDAISKLAEVGAPTRPAMTAAFIAFGVGVPLYAQALRRNVPGSAWIAATGTGLATLAVAAFPLGGGAGDTVHGVFATMGYVTLAATPWLAAGPLARSGQRSLARVSRMVAFASGALLLATTLGHHHGLFQRAGLTIGDAWVVYSAVGLMRAATLGRPTRGGVSIV